MSRDNLYSLFEEAFLGRGALAFAMMSFFTVLILWRMNRGSTPFRLADALIDPMTGKASILRTGFFVCLIAAWAVIFFYVAQEKEIPGSVQNTVLGVLSIFVVPLITNRAFEIFDPRTKAAAFNTSPAAAAVEAAKAVSPSTPPAATSTTISATATTEGKT